MKYVEYTYGELRSLCELARRAKMDWWFNLNKVKVDDLKDLICAFQIENIELMTNVDVMSCYDVFVRCGVMDSVARTELFKLFKDRKVYKDRKLVEANYDVQLG